MAPQDSFIDEDDDCCPLCVEEFDLSDKNFRPCPCGYQICQFCFNNIKNNINGLCPACRRPYDDKSIEWKMVTAEEVAQFKANIQKNAKKKAEQRQKEAQKREVESLNRKHLSGLRVVQKNLVYVTGLSPGIREEEVMNTLRGEKYFGQYGKILKIVVSKPKAGEVASNTGLGVYVTFLKKEDAARCIHAVNGSQNGDRILRAHLGTTKYCSAYLRGETCTNKQCMFLHEPGDNDDSYSRQDLSSINSLATHRPLTSIGSASSSRQTSQTLAPAQHIQPVAAAAQPMARDDSKDASDSGGDGSALPSSASWAKQRSRRGSYATSGAASSPAVSQSLPVPITSQVTEPPQDLSAIEQEAEDVGSTTGCEAPSDLSPRPQRDPVLVSLLKAINSPNLNFSVDADTRQSDSYPPLFDSNGGEKRRAMREQQEEDRLQMEQESETDHNSVVEPVEEEEPDSGLSGSLQLGGEPEDSGRELPRQLRRESTQHPIQRGNSFGPALGQNFQPNVSTLSSINGRALTPQQQSQLMLMKSGAPQSTFIDQYPPGMGSSLGQPFTSSGHNRQTSRYTFGGEGSSASVKPSANPKFLAQQNSMMPSGGHFYGSSMPGPPPGLKSSGTPPVGAMFKQGFGIYTENDLMRGRGMTSGSQGHEKLDLADPSILQARMQHGQSNAGVGQGLYGGQAPGGYNQSMMYGGGAGYSRGW